MSQTRKFHVRTVLTVTSGRLLTKSTRPKSNGIEDMYELLEWMTGEAPFTHQLGRFSDECKPWLIRWFPELDLTCDDIESIIDNSKEDTDKVIDDYVKTLNVKEEYDIPKIPKDDHVSKNPYDELVEMRGTDEGIIVVKPE